MTLDAKRERALALFNEVKQLKLDFEYLRAAAKQAPPFVQVLLILDADNVMAKLASKALECNKLMDDLESAGKNPE